MSLVMQGLAFAVVAQLGGQPPKTVEKHIEPILHWQEIPPNVIRPVTMSGAPGPWFSPSDFPEGMPETGPVEATARLTIGPNNEILNCVPDPKSDSNERLNSLTCPLIEGHGKFVHALSSSGMAVSSSVKVTLLFTTKTNGFVDWGFSPAPPRPVAPYKRRAKPKSEDAFVMKASQFPTPPHEKPFVYLSVNVAGQVEKCEINHSSGSDEGDTKICRHMLSVQFQPKLGADGQPIPEPRYFAVVTVN